MKELNTFREYLNEDKKEELLQRIKDDFSTIPSSLERGDYQSLEIEGDSVLFSTRYLGNWEDDEEDQYDDDFDESDWEDNDNRKWSDYSEYRKIFEEWVSSRSWKDFVNTDVDYGEKDWAYFKVRLK